jgi:hypothetical protein
MRKIIGAHCAARSRELCRNKKGAEKISAQVKISTTGIYSIATVGARQACRAGGAA